MLSIDTNILLYAAVEDSPHCGASLAYLISLGESENVIISEFVLLEFYAGLRNEKIMRRPFSPAQAVKSVQAYRSNPHWRVVGFSDDSRVLHDKIWANAEKSNYPRRKIYDDRLAFTLLRHGVTDFATANTKDFVHCGFKTVFNPLKMGAGNPRKK